MFKFKYAYDHHGNYVTDISTLQDIALGYLNDEKEANRVAMIAGNMTFGDIFASKKWMLSCMEDE